MFVLGGVGDDTIHGGEGEDVATYSGKMSDYRIDTDAGTVTDNNPMDGDDGTDEDANEGTVSLRDLRRLGNFILFLQDGQTGGFTSRYIPSKGGRDGSWTSLYYPGEAALGLMMLYEVEDDDAQRIRWYRGASRAIRYLYEVRKDLPLAKVEPDHWALIATERLLAQYDRIHPVGSNSSLRGDREGGVVNMSYRIRVLRIGQCV